MSPRYLIRKVQLSLTLACFSIRGKNQSLLLLRVVILELHRYGKV